MKIHVGYVMSYILMASALGFLAGLAAAAFDSRVHIILAGLYGGLVFPLAVYTNFLTGLSLGRPREGVEAVIFLISISSLLASPIILAVVGVRFYALALLSSLSSLLIYAVIQISRPRAWRGVLTLSWLAPPASGAIYTLHLMASGGSEALKAALDSVLYISIPVPLVMAPQAVGASIYGLGYPRGVEGFLRMLPSLAFPLSTIASLVSGSTAPIAASIAAYSVLMRPWKALSGRKAISFPRTYLLAVHASSLASALAMIWTEYTGSLDLVTLAHLAFIGYLAPHAFLHSLVRGGEIPLTRRPRTWIPAPAALLMASSLLRPAYPDLSLIAVLAATILHASILISTDPRDIVPRAFRTHNQTG